MTKAIEEIIRDRIFRKSGKDFQQLFWDILICQYPDLQTPKMQHDLGNDGYSIEKKTFFAVYATESSKYDNKETSKKIKHDNPKDLGDYNKFVQNWKNKYSFEKWVFVTTDNLMGRPHQKITKLNDNGDGVKKENWGLEQIVKLALGLNASDQKRIFNFPESIILPSISTQSTEVETIMDLIEYISTNEELKEGDLDNVMPDPEKKIYQRFIEYCKEIESEIVAIVMYATAQKEAEQVVGLDGIKIGKITAYLKQRSRRMLRENNDNPMEALDKLTDYFENILKQNAKHYDYNAIRYYLIGEIPKCNVFPND